MIRSNPDILALLLVTLLLGAAEISRPAHVMDRPAVSLVRVHERLEDRLTERLERFQQNLKNLENLKRLCPRTE
jgi:hypothetical protein